ncbi:MAG: TetR/AcrR family transcriptional regulator [Microbacterium sp.]|nr:TetR/AcrR family transcriptional regulator [Microbacterium sp.]MCV0376422.1 TetR/AcrR family transcriptional regulator [Microbacterium sp.]MCV0389981.1 TetR/AcrR family transcriptional regulator [Microbacterium sp.]MCV0419516.1 TetR/AcrR family transcriptional regulator [Microbacterium sp.]MCV0421821.1 TetR/AcrR family transcriptional regulator [Microbacterium sp.]
MTVETSTLTERRRAATERDIAAAAAALFAEQSVAGVTAEQIAARAGVSVRTFYRYFARKEDAITPILSVGAQRWQEAFAQVGELSLREQIPAVIHAQLAEDGSGERSSEGLELDTMLGVLRGLDDDTAMRDVWLRVNDDSERRLRAILRERGIAVWDAALLAAVATASIRVGLEQWAADPDGARPAERAVEAFQAMSQGLDGLD